MIAVEGVRMPGGSSTIGGILAVPEGRRPFPAVIMIPTIRVLNDVGKDVVERLARENSVTLTVNFLDHPAVPEDIFERPGAQTDEP